MNRIIILLAAILVLLAACTKETLEEAKVVTGESSPVTFTAKALVRDNALTKMTLNGSDSEVYDVVWSSGDGGIATAFSQASRRTTFSNK